MLSDQERQLLVDICLKQQHHTDEVTNLRGEIGEVKLSQDKIEKQLGGNGDEGLWTRMVSLEQLVKQMGERQIAKVAAKAQIVAAALSVGGVIVGTVIGILVAKYVLGA